MSRNPDLETGNEAQNPKQGLGETLTMNNETSSLLPSLRSENMGSQGYRQPRQEMRLFTSGETELIKLVMEAFQ